MDDAATLDAAVGVLRRLGHEKPWLTARVIAKRIRSRLETTEPSQQRLYALLRQEAGLGRGRRRLRNSRYPSTRTLETLWAAIGPEWADEREVRLPEKQDGGEEAAAGGPVEEVPEAERSEVAEEALDAPDTFLSYRFRDKEAVFRVTEELEAAGHSIWIAGARILRGQNINDEVIRAIESASRQILYLSRDTFGSLWVGKEILFGARRELVQSVVLQGDDPELVGLIVDWMEKRYDSPHDHLADYAGVSEGVALDFQQLLKNYLLEPERSIYLYPAPAAGARGVHSRMLPLSDYPPPGVA